MQYTLGKNLPSVTMLRGIACLAVCIAHLTGTVNSKIIQEIGHYGTSGVAIFFVISGFIIPYALYYSSYQISNYPDFLLKRIIRLDPPYLLSILGIFLLSCIAQFSPYHTAGIIEIFNINTLYHLFYLVEIFDGKWFNVVFWTLAIEFQFYLVIGLLFPLFNNKKRITQLLVFISLCVIPFILPQEKFVSNYMLMFLPGLLLFCFKTGQINLKVFFLTGIITLTLNYFKAGLPGIICPLIAVGFILFVNKPIKPFVFLGTISYSLYLIHTPFGTDGLINFLQNYILSDNGRIWLMIFSFPAVIFAAWVFYLIVEKPSINLNKKISYRKISQPVLESK